MTVKKMLIIMGVVFVFEMVILFVSQEKMELPDFQNVARWNLVDVPENGSTFWTVNRNTAIMMFLIDIFLVLTAFLGTRNLKRIPGTIQSILEIVVEVFSDLITQTLGDNGVRHIPMLISLFLFLWISNIVGFIPFAEEPTRDLNVPVGHMMAVLAVVHFEAMRVKGIKTYLKSYNEPFFIMMPLNVIGEFAKGVSLAFRLFGNILGGAIIVMVISYLTRYIILPVGLNMFFGLFVGTIQAFVFTMLAMTYMAVAIAE